MARREIDRVSGTGNVYVGDHLLRVTPYELSIFSDDADDAQAEGSLQVTIEGTIDISGIGEAVALAGAQPLTLHLEDGRRVVFTLTSTTGRIQGRLQPS